MLALDTETYLIEQGCVAPRFVCLTICADLDPPSECLFTREEFIDRAGHIGSPSGIEEYLRGILDREQLIVGQNIAYDMGVLAANFPALQPLIWQAYEEDRIRDTMIRAKLLDIRDGVLQYDHVAGKKYTYSLDALAQRYLGISLDKNTWRLEYYKFDGLPLSRWPAGAVDYPLTDSRTTFQLWQKLDYASPDEWLQVRGAWALHLATCWGLRIDRDRVAQLRTTLDEMVEQLKSGSVKQFLKSTGGRSMVAIREVVAEAYSVQGLDIPKTEKGDVSTSEDTLRQSGDEDLIGLADYNALIKVRDTFIPKLDTNIVTPSYNSLLITGRTSCYGDINIQQLPRVGGVRECFIPREGWWYVQVDLPKGELCAFSEVCYNLFGYSIMGDMLKAGKDPHLMIGCILAGISYDEGCQIEKDENHPRYEEIFGKNGLRQFGKIGNFGLLGGMGADSFRIHAREQLGMEVSDELAHRVKSTIHNTFHEQKLYFQHISRKGDNHSYQQLHSGRVRGGLRYTDGCNTSFQGKIADLAKEATYELQLHHYNCLSPYGELYEGRLVAFIHDEWISEYEGSKSMVIDKAKAKVKLLTGVWNRWIPHVPMELKYKIMDRWQK
jgi:DNA polymerase I-like protein with 3'-5' exonuclease and polymerase domains